MLSNLIRSVINTSPKIRSFFWKQSYNILSSRLKNAGFTCMNYGFDTELFSFNDPEKFSKNLYTFLLSQLDNPPKSVLEIGCGRGGGLAHVQDYFLIKSCLGIDFSKDNIKYCIKNFETEDRKFMVADALNIPLENNSQELVLNIESSHCYESFEAFGKEVYRILQPNGVFLFTDFRQRKDYQQTLQTLCSLGFELETEIDITKNVVSAMEKDAPRKLEIMQTQTPKWSHGLLNSFAGLESSRIYNALKSENDIYFVLKLRKQ